MPCNCSKKNSTTGLTYTVKYPNGSVYKVYTSKIEADAAALRVNGRVVTSSS
jgi:hypothetical protein